MTPNQFTDTYKRLSDSKLLDIIENKKDYQPLAIETAIFELESRQLSEQQIADAKQQTVDKKNRKEKSDKVSEERIEAIKNTADKALSILDPLVEKTPDRSVKLIFLALAIASIFKIVSNLSLVASIFQDTNWDFSVAIFIFDLLFLPIALIPFGRKKNSGRILLSIWLTYNLVSGLSLIFLLFSSSNSDSPLAFLLPQTNISTFIMMFFVSVGLLYYINKKDVKALFK